MPTMQLAARLIGLRLSLECDRAVAVARGEMARAREIDETVEQAQLQLDRLQMSYPGDVIGQRYGLDGAEMLALTLALMPHHRPEGLAELSCALGDDAPDHHARLWYLLALLGVPEDEAAEATSALLSGTLFGEQLVRTRPEPVVDLEATLHPHLSVLELFGLR